MKAFALAALALSLTSTLAHAEVIACSGLSAVIADRDPNGVNVRSLPSTSSKIKAVIGAKYNMDHEEYAADVSILGTDGKGWFLVTVSSVDSKSLIPGDGTGWIHGSRLATFTRGPYDPSEPIKVYSGSSEVTDYLGTTVGEDQQITPDFCQYDWVRASFKLKNPAGKIEVKRGFIKTEQTCSSLVTICN